MFQKVIRQYEGRPSLLEVLVVVPASQGLGPLFLALCAAGVSGTGESCSPCPVPVILWRPPPSIALGAPGEARRLGSFIWGFTIFRVTFLGSLLYYKGILQFGGLY